MTEKDARIAELEAELARLTVSEPAKMPIHNKCGHCNEFGCVCE